MADDVRDLIDRFFEALNSRDLEGLRDVLADDVEFRTRQGATLRGAEEAQAIVNAAEEAGLRLTAIGDPEVDGDAVRVPVRERTGSGDSLEGTAELELRDGKVAAFGVVTNA
jgi:ketosteroid isomerase-like protein